MGTKVLWTIVALAVAASTPLRAQQTGSCAEADDFSLVRDPYYCYRFYQCIDGSPYPLRCPDDQWFDEGRQVCDDPAVVECELEDRPPTVTPTPGICNDAEDNRLVLHPLFCNEYYLCVGQIGFPVMCPTGLWFDEARQICGDPADISCPHGRPGAARCRDEPDFGLVRSEYACYRYYQCVNGFPYPMVCPEELWFDAERDLCDVPENVQCVLEPSLPVPPTPGICNETPNNAMRANPTACNKYYVCINEIGWSKYCPLNLWFDEARQTCSVPGATDCALGPPLPPPRPDNPCNDVENLGFVRDEYYCYEYYQCRNGYPFPLICPADQWFDEGLQRCADYTTVECEVADGPPPPIVPTPGICNEVYEERLVLHPRFCNQYYICSNQIGIPVICPTGLWFSEDTQSCVSPLLVDCPHGVTPPPEDPWAMCDGVEGYGYVRHPNYCYRYFQCIDGTPYPMICEGDLIFDRERQVCDEQRYVQCEVTPPPVVRPPSTVGICIDAPDGQLEANPQYCNQYYICIHEAGWRLVCPLGLWFDVERQTCSEPGTVECGLAPERPSTTPSPYARCSGIPNNAYVRDDSYCYRYYKCVNGSPFPMICPNEQWFDDRLQQCRPQEDVICVISEPPTRPPPTAGICNGVANRIQVRHPTTCNQFYVCDNQIGFPLVCPFAMWFDEERQTCLPVAETACDLGPPTTTTLAPHPWGQCDTAPNYSFVRNEYYCYRYFQCVDGRPYPLICAGELWFDEERQVCDEQANVRCVVNPAPPTVPATPGICDGVPNGEMTLNPRACNQYYICVDQIGYSLLCPEGLWFDAQYQRCGRPGQVYCPLVPIVTTPDPFEVCDGVQEGGLLRNEFYCYRYFQCKDGVPYPMICRAGLWFDQERQVCDEPSNVQCFLRPGQAEPPVATPGICVGVPNGQFTRNWNFCNQYYLCVDQVGWAQICPDGLWYDEDRQICDLIANVQCPMSPTTIAPSPWDRCVGVEDFSFVEDEDFCYRYYQCVNGIPYPLICPNDQWFDLRRQVCDSTDNVECEPHGVLPPPLPTDGICTGLTNSVQVLHPVFCNRFYICVDQVGFPQSCAAGLWFDESRQTCASPLEVECPNGLTTTPSPIQGICDNVPAGTYVPNPLDCSRYYVCVNYYPYSLACPGGTWFDRNRLQCVPIDEAECADTVTTVPTPGICYGLADGLRVPSPDSCSLFYTCYNEGGTPSFCPPGQWFNEELQDCDDPENVDCTREPSTTAQPTTGICEGQPDGRYVASPYSCTQFYVCVNDTGYPSVCGPGLWFSEAAQDCVDPDDSECVLEP
ncbi:LOW QUALITY PROTEIN: uncharacterized protein LOC131214247 [Anopheles bellator]|uniref:LOW QUALITY PROTEIN: uncharacterized protein LOC131214246 n=1 Tax=Anopheles bellator TaxID=139047 RepID=UPI00264881E2|nr:LOW QUALITY PROTEIN: uncharacterized protein LOC131214246 [Anopheles bellator]XP_058064607.1 LOW QUALITY PROTEIN: uncharacterized protein LOC131214247 [Anopheles bellator]